MSISDMGGGFIIGVIVTYGAIRSSRRLLQWVIKRMVGERKAGIEMSKRYISESEAFIKEMKR